MLLKTINAIRAYSVVGFWILTAAVILILPLTVYEYARWKKRIPKFYGPFGRPVTGNLLQIQRHNAPLIYKRWAQTYGSVFQVQLGDIPMLVINSAAAAREILLRHSHATTSRPTFYTFYEVVSQGNDSDTTIGTTPYSPTLKKRRKTLATALNRSAVASYMSHIDRESRLFLKETLQYGMSGKAGIDPSPLFLRMNVSLSFTLHWGSRVDQQSDLFREIIEIEEKISNFRSTTDNAQDYVPLLRYLPFNSISSVARAVREWRKIYTDKLDHDLDVGMENDNYQPCIRANAKLDPEENLSPSDLSSLKSTITAAGLDTMQATVLWGLAVLCTMPHVQEEAFKAIRQKHPASNPLCDVSADQSVQYLHAMIREILRCYPATRLSLPRRTIQDFVYDGKRVPERTILVLNSWACNNDTEIWSDPQTFRPERWLEQPEAPSFTFGVGSRMCIGSNLAQRELYVLFMRLISAFKIQSDGTVDADPMTGAGSFGATVTQPKKFHVKFIPRDLATLEDALADADDEV